MNIDEAMREFKAIFQSPKNMDLRKSYSRKERLDNLWFGFLNPLFPIFHVSNRVAPSKGQPGYNTWAKERVLIYHFLDTAIKNHFAP